MFASTTPVERAASIGGTHGQQHPRTLRDRGLALGWRRALIQGLQIDAEGHCDLLTVPTLVKLQVVEPHRPVVTRQQLRGGFTQMGMRAPGHAPTDVASHDACLRVIFITGGCWK